jgi:hypothetical protein
VYCWSIVTNAVGRLETYWLQAWRPHKVADTRNEWFVLPDAEVARFRAVSVVYWRDLPPVPDAHRAFLLPPPPASAMCGGRGARLRPTLPESCS